MGSIMLALTLALAVTVGLSLGLLGGGGAILTVPLLTYVAGVDPKPAIAMSLLVVGVTSTVAAAGHARAGRVRWRLAAIFGPAAMAGAYAGGQLAHFIPGTVLLIAFAGVMIAAGIAMLRPRPESACDGASFAPAKAVALGVGVGLISGLVGAGGGFLLVPALTLFAGLPMPTAVGTSLVIIAAQSYAGLAGHLANESLDWSLAAMVTVAAVAGAVVGGRLVHRIDPAALRQSFGWLVLFVSAIVLAKEIHPAVGAAVAAITALLAVTRWACTRRTDCPLRRIGLGPNVST